MGNVVCGLGPAPGVHDVHIAALDGDFDEVKRLLLAEPGCVLARCEAVADGLSPADAGVAPGMTVLAIAARHGHVDMIELLLTHPLAQWAGLDVNAPDDRGLTPLMPIPVSVPHCGRDQRYLERRAAIGSADSHLYRSTESSCSSHVGGESARGTIVRRDSRR